MLDKKEKVITILTKTCNLIILRNGERGRRKGGEHTNVVIYHSKMT